LDGDYESSTVAPDRDVMVREDLGRVLQAMDSLPPRQRQVLYLHACEGLALGEIASALAISPEAVKASLCEARKRLRRRFREGDCGAFRSERDLHG
jgi:RNA polymerase sigma factor (sigma-70 family)